MPWLEAVLADARGKGIPVVVMGNRSLNTSFTPKLNVASDGDQVAHALVDGGASAYLFDRPEENRADADPAGAAQTIPSFGIGTLGYRSPIAGAVGLADRRLAVRRQRHPAARARQPAEGSNVRRSACG